MVHKSMPRWSIVAGSGVSKPGSVRTMTPVSNTIVGIWFTMVVQLVGGELTNVRLTSRRPDPRIHCLDSMFRGSLFCVLSCKGCFEMTPTYKSLTEAEYHEGSSCQCRKCGQRMFFKTSLANVTAQIQCCHCEWYQWHPMIEELRDRVGGE